MMETKLRQEIDQIIAEHDRRQAQRKRTGLVIGVAVLLAGILAGVIFVLQGSGEKAEGPYESIAGTYRIHDVDVLDMFEFPEEYDGMGECTIEADGSITFPYYDGESDGNGEFGMISGTLKRYQYAEHDYEITVPGYTIYDVYLDVTGSGIRIHEESTRRGVGYETWYRKIDYYFR